MSACSPAVINHQIPDYHNHKTLRRLKGYPQVAYTCDNGELAGFRLYAQVNSYHIAAAYQMKAERACKQEYLGKNYEHVQRWRQVKQARPRDCTLNFQCWW